MPRSKETVQLNIGLPPSLATTVETLAQRDEHQGSKSHFVETCIRAYIEDTGSMGALDTLHEQLATMKADLSTALQTELAALDAQVATLATQVQTLAADVARMHTDLTAFLKQLRSNHTDLQDAFLSLRDAPPPPKKSGWLR